MLHKCRNKQIYKGSIDNRKLKKRNITEKKSKNINVIDRSDCIIWLSKYNYWWGKVTQNGKKDKKLKTILNEVQKRNKQQRLAERGPRSEIKKQYG